MCEFDSGAGISTGRPRFTYGCVVCDRPWTTTVPPHENPRCPRCAAAEIERHKAVLRDKPPQPRFDTREDWVNFWHNRIFDKPRDTVTAAEVLNRIDYNLRVREAERRNRARKIREAKAAIRAAHAKLAELRGSVVRGPHDRVQVRGEFKPRPTFTAGEISPTLRRWRMKVGDIVFHAASARRGMIVALHPGPEWAADVRFYDLPEHPVRLPTASLELIG